MLSTLRRGEVFRITTDQYDPTNGCIGFVPYDQCSIRVGGDHVLGICLHGDYPKFGVFTNDREVEVIEGGIHFEGLS